MCHQSIAGTLEKTRKGELGKERRTRKWKESWKRTAGKGIELGK